MGYKNNLREWRESARQSREQLAEAVGVTAVSIFRIENGTQQPRPALLQKLCRIFNRSTAEFYAQESNVVEASEGNRWIPILGFVEAGEFAQFGPAGGDDYEDSILTDLEPSPNSFAMRIHGRSMEPDFREGDLVLIDPGVDPRAEDFVVAYDDRGDGSFKQYRDVGLNERGEHVFELVSLNPAYPSWRSDRKKISIRGTMIEHRRLRRT